VATLGGWVDVWLELSLVISITETTGMETTVRARGVTLELKQVEAHNTTRLRIISFLTIFSSCRNLISSFFVDFSGATRFFQVLFPQR